MRIAVAGLVALGMLATSAILEEPDLSEFIEHHGYRHVDDESQGHHHGDRDDHHESPGSPCHHHEAQVCPGHGNEMAPTATASFIEPVTSRLVKPVTIEHSESPTIHLIFHIPIA